MQFKNNLSCICSFWSMSIIFTLCTLNSTLVNYYYNVKYTIYMVYFSIIMVVYFSITIYSQYVNEQVINIAIFYDGIWYNTFILEVILQ